MAQTIAADATPSPIGRRPARPIDLVHLARQCLGDAGLEHEILRMFDTTAKVYFGRLERASTHEELALTLHSLKGAAGGVGAWAIADLARAAETELKAGRPIQPERIADIGMAVEEVGTFVARMLSKEPI
ncbi:Hpt domain-containing protein [uncultured Devosia sp.]|uniref:Hpt domain-containing protein n=1 Tax=uncultured Devosia sp. TaxID=211434 RepID=UPI0035CACA44